jgi:Tc toxin complex TcA C-terminal TcB-binding domain/Neuraminidase-like domain
MTVAIKKQLDESLRDALLALYLNKVVPADATTKTLKLKTAQDLYEYWLLDVLVSQDVPTTPVACAIASLQQYINRILMNLEPGYDSATLTPAHLQTWRSELHQYSTWAAHQKLLYFPATYLDPTLRNNKSDNFRQLENDLNQSRIQPDAVQAAVLAYLTRFEEVANLNILNGYIDGEDFANSTYYFIAKSRSENTYFWRSLNMAQRPLDGTPPQPRAIPPKLDQPDPYAWSDWEKADVPIPDDAVEHTIRPVWFNNRLFVVWAQCIHQDPAASSRTGTTSQADQRIKSNPLLRLSLCYRKPDNSWSTPRVCLQGLCTDETLRDKDLEAIKPRIGTRAVHRQEDPQNSLFMALFVHEENTDTQASYTFLKTADLDKNLTLTPGLPQQANKPAEGPALTGDRLKERALDVNTFQAKLQHLLKTPIKKTLITTFPVFEEDANNGWHSLEKNKIPVTIQATYDPSLSRITVRISSNIKLHTTSDGTISSTPSDSSGGWRHNYVLLRKIHNHNKPYLGTYHDFGTTGNSEPSTTLPDEFITQLNSTDFYNKSETLYYGIMQTEAGSNSRPVVVGGITLEVIDARPPKLARTSSTQYIDFTNSTIDQSDKKNQLRAPIRLNTVFAAELTHRTENSLDELFSRSTQHLSEPPLAGNQSNQAMDFHGPYGRYFTELFLYLPWLVAHRLSAEHQYNEAERWVRYLFDPDRSPPDCWHAVPLTGADTPSYSNQAPHDPHQIALSHPVHFRKALYFLYLDILINRGDAAYRDLTPDSLGEAKLWYVRVLNLLGPRPVVKQTDQWGLPNLHDLSSKPSEGLRTFENSLAHSNTLRSLRLREGNQPRSLPAIDTPHLRLPFNPELLKRWDIAESRLYNLRHNLDITGKPLHLPLFAAPLDPRALFGANAVSTSGSAASGLPSTQIPHHRFSVMHSQALNAVESVCQFGATLLSLIERKEQAQLQELQQQQVWNLAKMTVDLHTQVLRIDRQNHQALLASKAIIQGRFNHYQHLLEKDVTPEETAASQLYLSSGASEVAASASQVIAGGMMMAPNIFGFSVGGSRWEGAMHAATALAQGSAVATRSAASHLERTAQFSRRREEWTLTRDQAQLELAQIDAQLKHFAEQETATRLQLRLTETTLSQARANYDFLSKRFTKTQLYQWLNSQFAALYYQAYDMAQGMCLTAEACWHYEMADFSRHFVQPGAWNATYRGLGAGEQLKLSLLKMQAEYLQRNKRELEIRKTVSLRQIKDKDKNSSVNKTWLEIQTDLKNGACDFELTHTMFEDDYQGQNHYLRRIKTISVSLPALLGPYENIRATLTQTSSKVFMSPGDEGANMENKRANQQIALSSGIDDNGLFTLNFNDERYLPFEYTGAISKWRLTFPNPDAQKAMLESLTDIIVHVSYTARAGGGSQ